MSLVVGLESPIGENGNLLAARETGLELFSRRFHGGSRVTVIAKTEADGPAIANLFAAILPARSPDWVLSAWMGSVSSMTATRAKMRAMKLEKSGWEVLAAPSPSNDETRFVARQRIEHGDWVPRVLGEGQLMLSLADFTLSELAARFSIDLAQIAGRGPSPSYELIEWVSSENGVLGYRVEDDFNRPGVVLVGKLQCSNDLLSANGATVIHRDAEAGLVLRQGLGS